MDLALSSLMKLNLISPNPANYQLAPSTALTGSAPYGSPPSEPLVNDDDFIISKSCLLSRYCIILWHAVEHHVIYKLRLFNEMINEPTKCIAIYLINL